MARPGCVKELRGYHEEREEADPGRRGTGSEWIPLVIIRWSALEGENGTRADDEHNRF